MLTIERKIYLENYLNENYPLNITKKILNLWRSYFSEEEVAYLHRAYYLPITKVKEAGSNLSLKMKLYETPVIKEAIDYRFIEVDELLNYLEQVLKKEKIKSQNYEKLVRDNIPDIIKKNGEFPLYRELNDEEYWLMLIAKDKEELEELKKAKSKEEICEELADKLAVLIAMAEFHQISLYEVIQKEIAKRSEKGGFTRRLYLYKVFPKEQ